MRWYVGAVGAWLIPGAILVAVTGMWWVFPIGLIVTAIVLRGANDKPESVPMERTLDGVMHPTPQWKIERAMTRQYPPVTVEPEPVGPPVPQPLLGRCGTRMLPDPASVNVKGSVDP
ncbi:MAG: hypothetical protein M3132_05320 [Actinomycetia bacterium]|nr:hypothetical protein [Actinomycetes bacterium]